MAEYIVGRLQTPADKNGKRKDIHLLTSADCIIIPPKNNADADTDPDEDEKNKLTLDEKIKQLTIQVNTGKPEYQCMWARLIRAEPYVETVTE